MESKVVFCPIRIYDIHSHIIIFKHEIVKYYTTRKNCFRYLKLKSLLKNYYLTLRSKVKVPRRSLRYATHRLMVMQPHTKYHWPNWKDKTSYGPDKLRWEEAEAEEEEEKIRLKQYVSFRSKGRHNYCTWTRSIWGFLEQSTTTLNEAKFVEILNFFWKFWNFMKLLKCFEMLENFEIL